MLFKLKPKWKSSSATKRLAAVARLNPDREADRSALKELAQGDTDNDVQTSSVNKIIHSMDLMDIFEAVADKKIKRLCIERFSVLNANPLEAALPTGFSVVELLKASSSLPYSFLQSMAALSSQAGLRELAIKYLVANSDTNLHEESFLSICLQSEYTDSRCESASQLKTEASIDHAWREIKKRDKSAAKILKLKLDEYKKRKQLEIAHLKLAMQLSDAMQSQAKAAWFPQYAAKFDLLEQRWQALSDGENQALDLSIDKDIQARYVAARDETQHRIAQRKGLLGAEADQQRICVEYLSTLEELVSVDLSELPIWIEKVEVSFLAGEQCWLESIKKLKPQVGLIKKHQDLHHLISRTLTAVRFLTEGDFFTHDLASETMSSKQVVLIEPFINILDWPKNKSVPVFFGRLLEINEREAQARNKREKERHERGEKLHSRINKLQGVIRRGELKRAAGLYSSLYSALERLPDEKTTTLLLQRLEKVKEQLAELGDWKRFATEPKLLSLCEQMEGLIEGGGTLESDLDLALGTRGKKTPPVQKARAIKQLQDEWRLLGYTDGTEDLWQRFKLAGDQAYEPCAIWFKQQSDQRNANAEKRTAICQSLEQLFEATSWDSLDSVDQWKKIARAVFEAQRDTQHIRPVDRKIERDLTERFSLAVKAIDDKLAVEYEASKAKKQGLIDRAQALAGQDVSQHVLHQLKLLQAGWKQTGLCSREDEQSMWQQFKRAGDDIYQSHRSIQQKNRNDSFKLFDRAKDIIQSVRQLTQQSDSSLEPGLKKSDSTQPSYSFEQLQAEFKSLVETEGAVPEKQLPKLQKEFAKACDAYDFQEQRWEQKKIQGEFDTLRGRAAICDRLEALLTGGVDDVGGMDDVDASEAEELQQLWNQTDSDNVGHSSNKTGFKKINRRYEKAIHHLKNGSRPDFSQATLDRQLLCIRLDILTDSETPKLYKALRMEYQIRQFSEQGLGQSSDKEIEQQLQELEVEWLTLTAAESKEEQDQLAARFYEVLNAAVK